MRAILCISFLMLALTPAGAAGHEAFLGHWEGAEIVEGGSFPMVMDIEEREGKLAAFIGFPRNGVLRIPLANFAISGGKLTGEYGPRRAAPNRLSAELKDGKLAGGIKFPKFDVRIELARAEAKPAWKEEAITFSNGEVKLAGALVTPPGPGPHPAVVITHGSGDSFRGPDYYYADFFARRGMAAVVFDKRGCGGSTGDWNAVGFDELAGDAVAAVNFLKSRPEIDAKRIGLWGISQAGWIEPMAAAKSKDIAFLIVVSGGFVTVEREGYWDVDYWFPKKGYSKADADRALAYLKLENEVTRSGQKYPELVAMFREVNGEPWFKELDKVLPVPANHKSRDWYRRVMDIDHLPIIRSLGIPIVWFYGKDDDTFPAEEAAALAEKMKREDKKDFTIHLFPGTDHGMRVDSGQKPALPFRVISEDYLKAMDAWLAEKGFSKK